VPIEVEPLLKRHWTPKGVFSIRARRHAGSVWGILYLDNREITIGSYGDLIAETLARGGYDDLVGFETGSLNIPADFKQWNDGKFPGLK
jgi:hypothetical protein